MKNKSHKLEDILKLSRAEIKIIDACQSGFFSIADLSKKTMLPRMTINDNLKSLNVRGLLDTKSKGVRIVYTTRDIEETMIQGKSKDLPNSFVRVLYGKDALMKVWQEVALLPPLTRARLLQSELSIRESIKKIPADFIERLHKEHLKRNIIIDAIASDGIYSLLKKNLSGLAFSAMKGRSAEVNLISESFFKNNSAEMIILPNKAFLCDWKNEVGIEIQQIEIIDFLKVLFEICKFTAKKVDHNKVMQAYLEV